MIVGNNSILNQYVPVFYIRNLIDGQTLVYDSVRKAFINSPGGGGGAGATHLGELEDVSPNVDNPLSLHNGQALVYNSVSSLWENQFVDYNTLLNKPPAGGSVTTVSVVTANGISGVVLNPTTTPALTLSLGNITPASVAATGTVTGSNLSGVNTGNQTITLTGDITGSGTGTFAASYTNNLPVTKLNSGTGASATTYWRGDGIWATPPGGAAYSAGTGLTLLGSQFSLTVPVTAVTGGTGQTVYAVGDILYAGTTTTLSRLADVAAGSYLRSGGVSTAPLWSTTVLPNAATIGDIMVATSANTYTNLADIAVGNALISGGIGVAPTWDKIGLTTHVTGILPTPNGGTGLSIFVANEVFYAGSTSTVAQSTNFLFDGTSTMTVGGANPLTLNGATATIAATTTDSNITLTPNGTGTVIIGPAGAGIIKSDTAQPLKVTGTTILTLESGAGDIIMLLAGTTANKVTISGPTAANYIVGLADEDLVNKYYVDTVAGSAAGDVKAFKQVVLLSVDGTTNIGTVPATGATILSVKVNVTVTNPTATLSVGVAGDVAGYMLTTENDLQTTGLYVAETMVVNTAAQIIATVAGQTTGVGSATVIVVYQIAN